MWNDKLVQFFSPIQALRDQRGISERELSSKAKISRSNLRNIENPNKNLNFRSLSLAASALERRVLALVVPETKCSTEFSTIAIALAVEGDGFDSWKIHFMNLVDEFRKTLDPRLILLSPHKSFDRKLYALMASIVSELCKEVQIDCPDWANKIYFLDQPWFISGMQALKAMCLVESPLNFRKNNIFVLKNFLNRI